jgi:hypothetical protein
MAGANVNDAAKGQADLLWSATLNPAEVPATPAQGRTAARFGRLATGSSGVLVRSRYAPAAEAGDGVFADVVDVKDSVKISVEPDPEKARSFTS